MIIYERKFQEFTVKGTIIGGDYTRSRGYRGGSYTTYELFICYEGPQGDDLITNKAVTENTYKQYDMDKTIPLAYRQNNEYDTFIPVQSFDEIRQTFVHLMMLFLAFYFVAMYFLIKTWRKGRFSKILARLKSSDDDEDENFTKFESRETTGRSWDENPPEKGSTIENIRSNLASWNDKYREHQNKPAIEQRTRTWERRTLWILAGLTLIAGSIVFPFSSIDHNGKIFMNIPLLTILVSTFLAPVVFVFWRLHTKWYLPLLYFVIAAGISLSSFMLVAIIIDSPVKMVRVTQFYLLITVFGWIPVFIVCQFIKGVLVLVRKK